MHIISVYAKIQFSSLVGSGLRKPVGLLNLLVVLSCTSCALYIYIYIYLFAEQKKKHYGIMQMFFF